MELNMTAKLRQPNKTGTSRQPQTASPKDRTEPLTSAEKLQQAREDRLELSQEAVEFLKSQGAETAPEEAAAGFRGMTRDEQRQLAKEDERKYVAQALAVIREQTAQMQEQSKKQTDALKEALDKMKKCAKIAHNIGKGHKVPPKDEKYLLENDPKAYMMAMALRMLEEQDNKRVKSELKDEDLQSETGSAEAAPEAGGDVTVDAAAEAPAE